MAKLTLSFKDRKLRVITLQDEDCLIGREAGCTLEIDSLAIAPRHACIRRDGETFVIEPAGNDAVIEVNGQAIDSACTLSEGDHIQVGKHTLVYSEATDATAAEPAPTGSSPAGWMQIQSGQHLGRVIRLEKAFTRIGKPDGDLAVISRREDGYYLSHLQGEQATELNQQAIDDNAHRLQNGDRILVGELQLQYFVDAATVQDSPVEPGEQTEQRQFSRIPFDVPVTLSLETRQWHSGLIDISLHGALVRLPSGFEADAQQDYRLAIHLEGGPDINMLVQVAHQEDEELGLQCKDIDVDSITHLRRLVELNLGEPELLERELSALG
ncbi:MAG TPA: FHA domain-containing protein [Gammaproteobacteria bacterium]|nr:FHA domain-containing protein [Gammaproteobacteria bacterium]